MISASVIITGISIILCACLMVKCWILKMDLDLEETLHELNKERLDKYMRESIDDAETIMEWQKKYQRYIDEHGKDGN